MSLRVWLPLLSDAHNQGASDITPIVMGTGITYTAGKLGNAATFPNNCASCIHMPGLKLQVLSWCCWFKCTGEGSATSQRMLSEGRDTGSVGTNIWLSKAGTTLYWSAHKVTGSTTVALNTWYHVVLTCDGSKVHLYLDGKEIGTGTAYSADSDYTQSNDSFVIGKMAYSYTAGGNYFPFCGQMNDVRIYDHCLSAAEVKEISQGLVLHYKLDGLLGGAKENLLPCGGTYTQATPLTRTSNKVDGNAWISNSAFEAKPSTTYTISVECDGTLASAHAQSSDPDDKKWGFWLYICNTDTTKNWSGGSYDTSVFLSNNNNNYRQIGSTHVWTYTLSSTQKYISLRTNIYSNGTDNVTIKWWNMKVEEGDKFSLWVPPTSMFRIDTTKVEDSSGYGHHGSTLNEVEIASDSARYESCTHLVAGNSMINCGRGGMVTDSITVNIWIKASGWNNPVSCTEGGGWNFEANNGYFRFHVYIQSVGYKYMNTTKHTTAQIANNQWHMLTGVYDRLNQKVHVYVDGEIDSTADTGSSNPIAYHASNVVWIGGEATGSATTGSNGMAGYFSDFRIYATALSADDILELYHTSAKIDNLGSIHAFGTTESGNNKVTKAGLLESANICEIDGLSYLKYDPNVYIEPDGSAWVRIYHHNNPGAGSFSGSNDFAHSVYLDENRWFNVEVCDHVDKWEFMVKGRFTKNGDDWKVRWIQNVNPMTAAYADVAAANITKITGNGYDAYKSSWGGLYAKKGSAYLTTNNGNSGNWWGAVGSYSVYQSGIPGWGPSDTVTTTGFNDLYVRIDNLENGSPIQAKTTKNNLWVGHSFIEK